MAGRSKSNNSKSGGGKTIATNRKAHFDYHIVDTLEAGMVLTGTEIKSLRDGRANIADAFARPQNGELWLHNAHIAPYPQGGIYNHEPTRPRKLLVHKDQLAYSDLRNRREGAHHRPLAHVPQGALRQGGSRLGQGQKTVRQASHSHRPRAGPGSPPCPAPSIPLNPYVNSGLPLPLWCGMTAPIYVIISVSGDAWVRQGSAPDDCRPSRC